MKTQKGQTVCELAVGFALIVGLLLFLGVYIAPKAGELLASAAPSLNLHPLEKHGATVCERVDKCFAERGTLAQMTNPWTHRRANICLAEDGLYAVRIDEANGDLVTKFIKDKMKTFDQVTKYLINRGYTPLQ